MCGDAVSARAGHPDAGHSPPFVAFAYELGRRRATGVLQVGAAGEVLAIRDGAVVAADGDALGRQVAGQLARLALLERTTWSFRPAAVAEGGRDLPLTRWARQHATSALHAEMAARISGELAGARVQLRPGQAPELTHLDTTDRLLVTALATPRDLRELAALARAPRFRLLAFLWFLRSIGALLVIRSEAAGVVAPAPLVEPLGARLAGSSLRDAPSSTTTRAPRPATREARPSLPRAAALKLLGLPDHADAQRVRAAFRGLARMLHPDLHPGVGEQRRRDLERRLATVNAAYAELTAT